MRTHIWSTFLALALAAALPAQAGNDHRPPAGAEAADGGGKGPKVSDAARTALAAAKELAARTKGLRGAERLAALQQAAEAYDKLVTEFGAEPAVAASAAMTAGELWQRHGSFAAAERDYLLAAQLEPPQFGQRGAMAAGEMAHRQKQDEKALAAYARAVTADPATPRAQEARLARARLLQGTGKVGEAVVALQEALETASRPRQVVDACNLLGKLLIQTGDLEAAQRALEHADKAVTGAGEKDPLARERLEKALHGMSARKALQKARDRQEQTGKDVRNLEESGREPDDRGQQRRGVR